MRWRAVKRKFAALLSVFLFSALLVCIPVSAASQFDWRNIEPASFQYYIPGSNTYADLEYTKRFVSSSWNPDGNVYFDFSAPALASELLLRFDLAEPVILDSSYEYEISFLFGGQLITEVDTRINRVAVRLIGKDVSGGDVSFEYDAMSMHDWQEMTVTFYDNNLRGANFSRVTSVLFTYYIPQNFDNTYIWIHSPGEMSITKAPDPLIDGDGTPLAPNYNEDLNNVGDQMNELEDEALGGKSDEEIQQEVDNALSFDTDTLDKNAAKSMSDFFDDLLNVFGADYQALLMLALSLALAAFIIGRRYRSS